MANLYSSLQYPVYLWTKYCESFFSYSYGVWWTEKGNCTRGALRNCFKDSIKHNMVKCGIPTCMLESLVLDRQLWLTGIPTLEKKCRTDHSAKHLRRKNGDKKSQLRPASHAASVMALVPQKLDCIVICRLIGTDTISSVVFGVEGQCKNSLSGHC